MYYRNRIDLETITGDHIEAESLFRREGDTMILEDEDRHITFPWNDGIFYYVGLLPDDENNVFS